MAEIERWFSYSEDEGFRKHASADEARACAQRALDDDGDLAGDGWPEDTHSICWGEVREAAVETVVHEHGPGCRPLAGDEGWGCTEGHTLEFDYVSRFDLTPTARASEVAEATARAEAAEQRAEALAAEVARLRADRAVATTLAIMAMGPETHEVLLRSPVPLLKVLRPECLAALPDGAQSEDVAAYVREMCCRIEAEAQPAEVADD